MRVEDVIRTIDVTAKAFRLDPATVASEIYGGLNPSDQTEPTQRVRQACNHVIFREHNFERDN